MSLQGEGKCGLVLHADGDDAYYISLDVRKGLAQIRYWAANPNGTFQNAFIYEPLQAAHYILGKAPHAFSLTAFGSYIELSIDGYVRLTLADDGQLSGRVGFYTEECVFGCDGPEFGVTQVPQRQPLRFAEPRSRSGLSSFRRKARVRYKECHCKLQRSAAICTLREWGGELASHTVYMKKFFVD